MFPRRDENGPYLPCEFITANMDSADMCILGSTGNFALAILPNQSSVQNAIRRPIYSRAVSCSWDPTTSSSRYSMARLGGSWSRRSRRLKLPKTPETGGQACNTKHNSCANHIRPSREYRKLARWALAQPRSRVVLSKYQVVNFVVSSLGSHASLLASQRKRD